MLTILAKIFIKNYKETHNLAIRRKWGILSAALGIFFDIVLGAGKVIVGLLANSVAILADGINNLTDTASAIISLFGFKLAGNKPDKEHPFGHGRFEYIAGLIVSIVIIVISIELFRTSISKIFSPETPDFSALAIGTLILSILIKAYMFFYNIRLSKKLDAVALRAVAKDSLSDCVATFFIIIGALIYNFAGANLDGYIGIMVSCFVFYTGFSAAKDTMTPLIGQPPTAEFVAKIKEIVLADENILDMHDLIVHDYGPGRVMISLHAEVPASGNFLELHDAIDNIEQKLSEELLCHATIHMDPIENENPEVNRLKDALEAYIKTIDKCLSFHDFRVVFGSTHNNLIFDVTVPFDCQIPNKDINDGLIHFAASLTLDEGKKHYVVANIERSFV